jgi:catenin delta-2
MICEWSFDKIFLFLFSTMLFALSSGDNLGCFGANKKKKEAQPTQQKEAVATTSRTQRTEPVKGMELLWQPEVIQLKY